jgi:DNA-binding CsgD family transcriptional regulator
MASPVSSSPMITIVDAKSSKEIAVELGVSIKTVKVRSVAELVRYALQHGLVDL